MWLSSRWMKTPIRSSMGLYCLGVLSISVFTDLKWNLKGVDVLLPIIVNSVTYVGELKKFRACFFQFSSQLVRNSIGQPLCVKATLRRATRGPDTTRLAYDNSLIIGLSKGKKLQESVTYVSEQSVTYLTEHWKTLSSHTLQKTNAPLFFSPRRPLSSTERSAI